MPDRRTRPPLRALITGTDTVTPENRADIIDWLDVILNPYRSAPSPDKRTRQVRVPFGGPNSTTGLALQLLGDQYPEASAASPTLSVGPDWPWIKGRRYPGTGHVTIRGGIVPTDDDDPAAWRDKFLGLMDTLRHELSHGMGLPDIYSPGYRRGIMSAQEVSDASAQLHKDIVLPTEPRR